MTTTNDDTCIVLEREHLQRYDRLRRAPSIVAAARRIATIDADIQELDRTSNEAALTGAFEALRRAVLALVAIPARTIEDLEIKQHHLVAHTACLTPTWLVDPIIGAGLRIDYGRLALTPAQEHRMRAMLPGSVDS